MARGVMTPDKGKWTGRACGNNPQAPFYKPDATILYTPGEAAVGQEVK